MDKLNITRIVSLDDLAPWEMAALFANYSDSEQAAFFNCLALEVRDWPGTGWCAQAAEIEEHLDPDGKAVVNKLAEWIAEPLAREARQALSHTKGESR